MISIIVAVAQNGVIGHENRLLWHLKEDLRHFRALTTGHPVIMGRKTYESLGRPLPNRTNVVISRREEARFEGCITAHSLSEALAIFPADEEVFVIGGAQIYRLALPLADRFYLTVIEHDYEGDTRFPVWDASQWSLRSSESVPCGENFPFPFRFETYERVAKSVDSQHFVADCAADCQ